MNAVNAETLRACSCRILQTCPYSFGGNTPNPLLYMPESSFHLAASEIAITKLHFYNHHITTCLHRILPRYNFPTHGIMNLCMLGKLESLGQDLLEQWIHAFLAFFAILWIERRHLSIDQFQTWKNCFAYNCKDASHQKEFQYEN